MSFQELSQFKYHINNVISKMETNMKSRQIGFGLKTYSLTEIALYLRRFCVHTWLRTTMSLEA